jgi:hypothetical protein
MNKGGNGVWFAKDKMANSVHTERMYGSGEMQLGYIPSDISSVSISGSVLMY